MHRDVIAFPQLILIRSFSYLQIILTYIKDCMSSKFDRIRTRTKELAAFQRLNKFPYTYNWGKLFHHVFLSDFIGSFLYLQVMRTCIKAWMNSTFSHTPSLTTE